MNFGKQMHFSSRHDPAAENGVRRWVEGRAIARQKDVAGRSGMEPDIGDVGGGNGMYSFVIKRSVSNSAYYSSLDGERAPEPIVR